MRGDLGEWVAYLRDIGVRELAVPRAGGRRPAAEATATRRPGRPAPPPAPRTTQRVLLAEPEPPFSGPPPADPAARLMEIRAQIGECTRCKLHAGRTNIVFGVGNPRARILFIGEGPGENEDLKAEPFVGRAGQKLNEMIAAIGLRRDEVYIANIVKCRPPGNRAPERDEVATCSPFLVAQIEAIRPKVIVTLGGPSSEMLLRSRVGITRLRGQWHSYRGIPVMPTFHPAYLLRNYTVQTRKQVWEDLKAAGARASAAGPPADG